MNQNELIKTLQHIMQSQIQLCVDFIENNSSNDNINKFLYISNSFVEDNISLIKEVYSENIV